MAYWPEKNKETSHFLKVNSWQITDWLQHYGARKVLRKTKCLVTTPMICVWGDWKSVFSLPDPSFRTVIFQTVKNYPYQLRKRVRSCPLESEKSSIRTTPYLTFLCRLAEIGTIRMWFYTCSRHLILQLQIANYSCKILLLTRRKKKKKESTLVPVLIRLKDAKFWKDEIMNRKNCWK